jgi:hypothetical protein
MGGVHTPVADSCEQENKLSVLGFLEWLSNSRSPLVNVYSYMVLSLSSTI